MRREDEVSKSVYYAKLAFSLLMMKKLLASRFSEIIGEETPENWCKLRSSPCGDMRMTFIL